MNKKEEDINNEITDKKDKIKGEKCIYCETEITVSSVSQALSTGHKIIVYPEEIEVVCPECADLHDGYRYLKRINFRIECILNNQRIGNCYKL